MTVLSTITRDQRHDLADAVRAISWSPTGRLMALGADGRAMVDAGDRLTSPIGPDPIDCCWITVDRVAVLDGLVGVVVAGGGAIDQAHCGHGVCLRTATSDPRHLAGRRVGAVVVGGDGLTSLGIDSHGRLTASTVDAGPLRTAAHLGGSIWLAGGTAGLVTVDVGLDCVDERIDLPGVVALVAAPHRGRAVAAVSTGALHVVDISDLASVELSGYPDVVHQLAISVAGDVVVACADDELTWWNIADDGRVDGEPTCGVGHVAPITTCVIGAAGFVATGDDAGTVRLWTPALRDLPIGRLDVDGEVTALAWNPRGDRLAIGTAAGQVVVADIEPGDLL